MRSTLLLLFLFILSFRLSADIHWDEETKRIHGLFFDLRFDDAHHALRDYRNENPANLMADYLEHLGWFYRIFVLEDPSVFDKNKDRMLQLIASIDEEQPSTWRSYCLSEMHLQQAALNTKFRYDISAGFSAVKAHSILMEGRERYPDFPFLKTPHGLFLVTIGTLPEGYQNLAGLLGMKGDVQKGLKLLRDGWTQSKGEWKFLAPKHGFVYFYTRFQIEDFTNIPNEETLLEPGRHPLLQYVFGKHYLDDRNPKKTLEILSVGWEGKASDFPYLTYMKGKARLAFSGKGEEEFLRYLKLDNGGRYRMSTHRYLWWIHTLKGETSLAEEHRKAIMNSGSPVTGPDREAQWEYQHPIPVDLIQARLAFDRNDINASLEFLDRLDDRTLGEIDRQRWNYRRARCKLEKGDAREAARSFLEAIQGPDNTFEKAQSYLYLGQMMADRNDPELARTYWKRCLEQKDYPFRAGIQQKAKAGLSRL